MRSPIPIADCHAHVNVHPPDFPAYRSTPDEMIQVMDLLNIQVALIISSFGLRSDVPAGNDEVARAVAQYPGRFLGYIVVNPNLPVQAITELHRCAHFCQPPLIKIHPDVNKYPVNGQNYREVWEYADQKEAIVLVHTWVSDPLCGPLLLRDIAREFSKARIIIGHSGVTWKGYEQALEVAAAAPNTYLDISGSHSHRTILEHCVAQVGAERLLFGSDMAYLEPAMAVGRVLTARLSDEDKELILRKNLLRLLDRSD